MFKAKGLASWDIIEKELMARGGMRIGNIRDVLK